MDLAQDISDDFINAFERRARLLRASAALIFLIVLALLVTGAFVFLRAPSIAATDITAGDNYEETIAASLTSLREEVKIHSADRDRLKQGYDAGQERMIDLATAESALSAANQGLEIAELRLRRFRETGAIPPPVAFANSDELRVAIRHKERLNAVMQEFKNSAEARMEGGGFGENNVLPFRRYVDTLERELETLRRHLAQAALREAEGAELSLIDRMMGGVGEDQARAPTTTTHLAQTNITRFGTLVVVFFFIAVLQPIFRYNTRLGAYYDARADALLLLRNSNGQDLAALTATLTPALSFEQDQPQDEGKSLNILRDLLKMSDKEARK